VPDAVKAERLAALRELIEAQQLAFNRASVGRAMPVLLDQRGRRAGQLVGRSPWMQAVHLEAPEARLGEIVEAVIEAGHANSLSARLGAAPAALEGAANAA
jgi:tRNA-2-methylthio-N6-dimethylallyladenosine synthase